MSAQNSRFTGPGTPKPVVIITPLRESHVRAALICSRKYNIQLRTRSGGHDFEGLSYVSSLPFAILDLIKFRSIEVNVGEKTAWVQTGATLGELYYTIGNKSDTLAFPAGICPTVGTGGHISGGGYGMLLRKYGLAADHVIDARIMVVNGRILDRKSMGEDLFWAIRGGRALASASYSPGNWKLVPVPETVTCTIPRKIEALLAMMQKGFPELGVTKSDLTEMSWINSVTYHFPVDSLLNRSFNLKQSYKIKSDYAKRPFTPKLSKDVKIPVIQVCFSGIVGNIGSQFPYPFQNLLGKGAFGVVGLDLVAPFELSDFVTPNSGNPFCIVASKVSDVPRYSAMNKPRIVLPGSGNGEYRDSFRHRNQFQFPGEYDAEVSAAAAPNSPEEILPHGFPVQDSPVNVHDSGVNHVVRRQPIFSHHRPVPAAADVAAGAHRGTKPGRKTQSVAFISNGIVHFP
nr:tetrahydroberberine oxidase [Ipomoea batatas]